MTYDTRRPPPDYDPPVLPGTRDFGFLHPPTSGVNGGGSGYGNPRVSDLLGRVVAALLPEADRVKSDKWAQDEDGRLPVIRLKRLLVFSRDGTITAYPDFILFQAVLRRTVQDRPITIGRLVRPDQAYELEPLPNKLLSKAATRLIAEGWMNEQGQPLIADDRNEQEGTWDYDDDEHAF